MQAVSPEHSPKGNKTTGPTAFLDQRRWVRLLALSVQITPVAVHYTEEWGTDRRSL